MSAQTPETPLTGGNVNAAVTRIGDTVRRAPARNADTVHRFLQHLEAQGFAASPRFLGTDADGREMLSLLPGSSDMPETLWTEDRPLIAAAAMLRRFHAVSARYRPSPEDDWAYAWPDRQGHELICHNDFAPYNMLFENGLPTGIVDFDLVGPAPRHRDLAYLAYWLVPLSFTDGDLAEHTQRQGEAGFPRLRLICESYGTADRRSLLDMVANVLGHMGSETACTAMIGPEAAARLREGGHFDHWKREAAAYEAHLPELIEALS